MITLPEEELKRFIESRYEVDEFCDVLNITIDDLFDKFIDKVYDNYEKLTDMLDDEDN